MVQLQLLSTSNLFLFFFLFFFHLQLLFFDKMLYLPRSLPLLLLLLLLLNAPLCLCQTRTFTLINNCADTIWFKATSGAAPTMGGVPHCTTNSHCTIGSACDVSNGICYWVIPTPGNGDFRITPNGGRNSLTFPFLNNNNAFVWSGNLGACLNGTCNDPASYCDAHGCSTPGGSPETKAEFTLSKTGMDFYDVEVINGFNLPVAVYPKTTSFTSDPYFCGSPGATQAMTETADCSWRFSPPSLHYNWVEAGGIPCSSHGDCTSTPGTICGLSNNIGQNPRFKQTCGKSFGYWTANQVCGVDQGFGAPFNCNQQLPAPNAGNIMWNLYACNNGIPSCYQDGATTNCCGCANWRDHGLDVPANTKQCTSSNSMWVSNVQPGLQWLKAACPSVYTYPYDDMSSTFICNLSSGGNNVLNYDIVWCPR